LGQTAPWEEDGAGPLCSGGTTIPVFAGPPFDPENGKVPHNQEWTRKKAIGAALLLVSSTLLLTIVSYFWGCQDYFQDWASARNWWEHTAVYSPHRETLPRYLGIDAAHWGDHKLYSIVATVKVNAHPPSSVLFYLPLALLPYGLSFLAWNIVSAICLALSVDILAREWDLRPSLRAVLWVSALAMLSPPLFEQMFFGQSNAVTLAMIVLAWQAHRRGWQLWEGFWIGTAVALRLFPLVLLLVPLGARRWRSLLALFATLGIFFLLSAFLLGGDIWREYIQNGLPEAVIWGDLWSNASVSALWRKLFVSQNKGLSSEWCSPLAFWIGYLVSSALIGLTTLGVIALNRREPVADYRYGVAICAMLLLSPTCWPHYFVLLLLPLVLLWRGFQEAPQGRWMLALCLVLLFMPPGVYWKCADLTRHGPACVAGPSATIFILSLQTYAIAGVWLLITLRERRAASADTSLPAYSTAA
jgi:hypothetical protein